MILLPFETLVVYQNHKHPIHFYGDLNDLKKQKRILILIDSVEAKFSN
jgi:hypothetical protein